MVSWTTILSTVFFMYILNSIWTVYKLYVLPPCTEETRCIPSYLEKNSHFHLMLYQSPSAKARKFYSMDLIHKFENFDYTRSNEKTVKVKMLDSALKNGTVYAHLFLVPGQFQHLSPASFIDNPFVVTAQSYLTKYAVPEAKAFNLLGSETDNFNEKTDTLQVSNHWKTHLLIELVKDKEHLPVLGLPKEIIRYLKITPDGEYLPPLYIDTLNIRIKDLQPIDATTEEMNLTIYYNPISFGKLRLWTQLEIAMTTMLSLGFTEKDIDEVKGIFTDTNFYLLCTTFMIAAVHLMFDVLAFKNDIVFWSRKKTMVGLSLRTIVWRCISHSIIFLYLIDEQTSLLVLIPTGIGTIIEMWKVCKAFKVTVTWQTIIPSISFGNCSEDERKTELHDAQVMKYLMYVLYPACIGGAIYSLFYMPHKSWYSWTVQSLVNGVYAFGFLFMLPQLFVNYKLKSVAHLPWRAFMYKAFNTFIDDVFAFIITMPTAHRVACFRDDVVFLIYLYQRWLYPVDKSRINEFGDAFTDESKQKKEN